MGSNWLSGMILVTPFVLAVLILLTSLLGNTSGQSAAVGKGNETTVASPTVMTGAVASTTASKKTTMRPSLPRPVNLFCVLGGQLWFMHQTWAFYCSHIIYPGLEASESKDQFYHPGGIHSWTAFTRAIKTMPGFVPGVSFSALFLNESDGTVKRVQDMKAPLKKDLVDIGITCMGLFDYAAKSDQLSHLKPFFQVLNDTLKGILNGLTFLGVEVHNTQEMGLLVRDIDNILTVQYVVIQTHLSDPVTDRHNCKTRLISYKKAVNDLPSFEIAVAARTALRSSKHKHMGVMFSSSLAAVAYVGNVSAAWPQNASDKCVTSTSLDVDFICNANLAPSTKRHKPRYETDKDNLVEIVKFTIDRVRYFVCYESPAAVENKMTDYMKSPFDGWAVFDIQRDVRADCIGPDPFYRLQVMARIALAARKSKM
ncbi:uncharacterized protein LOC144159997 [Haemaphysalis longicornis]